MVGILVMLVVGTGLSFGNAPKAEDPHKSVERLSATNMFAFGGTGFAGVTSQGEKDLRVVLAQPRSAALAALNDLYASGDVQAKLYAIAGMRKLKSDRYREVLGEAEKSGVEVRVMRGCIVSKRPFSEVARSIDRGVFDAFLGGPVRAR